MVSGDFVVSIVLADEIACVLRDAYFLKQLKSSLEMLFLVYLFLFTLLLEGSEQSVKLLLLQWILEQQHLAWTKVDGIQVLQNLRIAIF